MIPGYEWKKNKLCTQQFPSVKKRYQASENKSRLPYSPYQWCPWCNCYILRDVYQFLMTTWWMCIIGSVQLATRVLVGANDKQQVWDTRNFSLGMVDRLSMIFNKIKQWHQGRKWGVDILMYTFFITYEKYKFEEKRCYYEMS